MFSFCSEHCSKFCKDIIETTKCQNNEIHSLRSPTLDTFSWVEEARAREKSGSEHKYVQLLRARPLDPRSVKMMEKLRSQFFYCEQQIEEVLTNQNTVLYVTLVLIGTRFYTTVECIDQSHCRLAQCWTISGRSM